MELALKEIVLMEFYAQIHTHIARSRNITLSQRQMKQCSNNNLICSV